MAWPETCAGALSAMKQSAAVSLSYSLKASVHIGDAFNEWSGGNDHLAIGHLIDAVSDANVAAGYAGYGYAPFDYVGPWWWYFTNCVGAVDMDAILTAMISATDEEFMKFIGIVDAYRVALWNSPFNSEFYAALARGFAH